MSAHGQEHFPILEQPKKGGLQQLLDRPVDRRTAMQTAAAALTAGLGLLQAGCSPLAAGESREKAKLEWETFFQGNYRLMDEEEKAETIRRLERSYELNTGRKIQVSGQGPRQDVLYGYAFNVSKCRGYMDCVKACITENNQDRKSDMRYIRIHEMKNGDGFRQGGRRILPRSAGGGAFLRRDAVLPLPESALHAGVPGAGDVDGTGRDRGGGLQLVHRVPVLHRGMPV